MRRSFAMSQSLNLIKKTRHNGFQPRAAPSSLSVVSHLAKASNVSTKEIQSLPSACETTGIPQGKQSQHWARGSGPDIFYYHLVLVGEYHTDNCCGINSLCGPSWERCISSVERNLYRIYLQVQDCKPKQLRQGLSYLCDCSTLPREGSKFLSVLPGPQPSRSGEAVQERLITEMSRCWGQVETVKNEST